MNQVFLLSRALRHAFVWVVLASFAVSWVGTANASERDHERALQAMEAGEIKALSDILAVVAQEVPGRVLEVELERERGQWIYEIKLIQDTGLIKKLDVDARSGQLLRSRND